jgi:hypothetical protein
MTLSPSMLLYGMSSATPTPTLRSGVRSIELTRRRVGIHVGKTSNGYISFLMRVCVWVNTQLVAGSRGRW